MIIIQQKILLDGLRPPKDIPSKSEAPLTPLCGEVQLYFFFSIFSRGIWYFLHEVLMRFCRITVNPLLSPPRGGEGGYLIQKRRCYQFSIKNFGIQSGKAPVQEGWRSCNWGSESNPNFQMANKPSQISPHEVLQTWLIITIYHLLGKNNQGRGEEEKGAY